jgi:hypothetical protein
VPVTGMTPVRLLSPGPGIVDDPAPGWPEPSGAELADWDRDDPEPDCQEVAGQEVAGREAAGREVLKAGRWDRANGDGCGFAAGGVADALPPGPVLAGFAADAWAAGLGRLSDDELIGVMRAARRIASWAAAMELAAIGDLWRRRMAEEEAGDAGAACHADDEIAAALTLTGRAADRVLGLAVALRRLPLTGQALAAGDIDLPRAAVIADEVTGLDDEHAAAVEQAISYSAPGQTTGQLRVTTRRAVMAADPSAARRRKERAQQDARVERWDEHAGTAALAGRDLPPASVLAADQNLTALARQLKAAGVPGTMDTLRAQAFLALLTGTSMGSLPPGGPPAPGDLAPPGFAGDPAEPGFPGPSSTVNHSCGLGGSIDHLPGHGGNLNQASGLNGTQNHIPGLSGAVNLTMPLATWLGQSDAPGHVAGYGPMDASDSRDLARALAARAGNPWCLTFTDARGRPVAHGCARAGPAAGRRRSERNAGPADEAGADARAGPRHESSASDRRSARSRAGDPPTARSRAGDPPTARSRAGPSSRSQAGSTGDRDRWTFTVTLLPGGACDHAFQTAAYQPPTGLRHLVEIRHGTCVFPGCRRPAAQCDKDHTVPYNQGGRTCMCNLAPLCRRHHQAKQAGDWQLDQPDPGVLVWRLPHGRSYHVEPTAYPAAGA